MGPLLANGVLISAPAPSKRPRPSSSSSGISIDRAPEVCLYRARYVGLYTHKKRPPSAADIETTPERLGKGQSDSWFANVVVTCGIVVGSLEIVHDLGGNLNMMNCRSIREIDE